ncbi:MAG: hypothetical protein GY725_19055 [bacterium]|nr:hypothetical protein [bacterium]
MTADGTCQAPRAVTDRLRRRENALFVGLIAAHLVPIWISGAFLTQDGPTHVATASSLLNFNDPALPIIRAFFFFNGQLLPNWIGHLLLTAFSLVFPPLIAEKVLVSAFAVLLPVSARYACRAFGEDRGFLALLIFPFIYTLPLQLGFYNFCLSTVQFFFLLGYWCRYEHDLTLERAVPLTGLTLLLYFSHGFGTMATCLIFFSIVGWMTLGEFKERLPEGRVKALRAAAWRPLGITLYACLPLFLLGVYVLINREVGGTPGTHLGFKQLAVWLATTVTLVVHDPGMVIYTPLVSVVFSLALILTVTRKVRQNTWHRWDGLLFATFVAMIAYFVMPGQFVNKWANIRFMPFIFFTALLWLAAQPHERWMRICVMVGSVLIALPGLTFQTLYRIELADYVDEFLSANELIEPNSTIVPLIFANDRVEGGRRISINTRPFLHAAGYIAAQRNGVEFSNYEGTAGVFPLSFYPEVDPYDHLSANIEWLPSCLDVTRYEKTTGMSADYVLWWNPLPAMERDPCMAKLKQLVAKAYTLRFESAGHGLLKLYERTERLPLPETDWEISEAFDPSVKQHPETLKRWRRLPISAVGVQGGLDLNRAAPLSAREPRCVYLRQVMEMKRNVTGVLRIASGDPYAILLDKQFLGMQKTPPVFRLDQTPLRVDFPLGRNSLYVKACSTDTEWRFALRYPAEVLKYRTLVR